MNKTAMIKKLVVLANNLDKRGLIKEANEVDGLIKKMAADYPHHPDAPDEGGEALNRAERKAHEIADKHMEPLIKEIRALLADLRLAGLNDMAADWLGLLKHLVTFQYSESGLDVSYLPPDNELERGK